MINIVLSALVVIVFSFYDPSLIIYLLGGVNEVAVFVVALLILFNLNHVANFVSALKIKQNINSLFYMFWVVWGVYFFFHFALGLTSLEFAASRIIRIIFVVFFFLGIKKYASFECCTKILLIFAVIYSILGIIFHVYVFSGGRPTTTLIHVPIVNVDYISMGIFGYIWPGNYRFPMALNGIPIYRISSFFNESAAYAFFLEPIVFYILHLRSRSPNKIFYSFVFCIVVSGIFSSTSLAGIAAVMLSFLMLGLLSVSGIIKKSILSILIIVSICLVMQWGGTVFQDIINTKQGTIALELSSVERSESSLSGISALFGSGYDFDRDSYYVSSNALLSNFIRGGIIGVLLFLLSLALNLWLVLSIGVKNIVDRGQYALVAMLPNFIHLAIKATYEFTFIYLINYCLVFWCLSNAHAKNNPSVQSC